MSCQSLFFKRVFDLFFSFLGLIFFSWLIFLSWLVATVETKSNGFFVQSRVGRYGKLFKVIKIKTMVNDIGNGRASVTTADMSCITRSGRLMRRFKLDELPQLWNVFVGNMSFVGPRPDVPGYADKLQGASKNILKLRPGITGPASIKYKNEEEILAGVDNPIAYNNEVIWPDKVKINLHYYYTRSILIDISCILETIFGR